MPAASAAERLSAGYRPVAPSSRGGEYHNVHVAIDTRALGLDRVTPTSGNRVGPHEAYRRAQSRLGASGMQVDNSRATDVEAGRFGFQLAVPLEGLAHVDPGNRDRAIRAHMATEVVRALDLGDKKHLRQVPAWQRDGRIGDLLFVADGSVFPPSGFGGILTTEVLPRFKDRIVDRHVLDMGTASGIIAVSAAQLGAEHVTATDINPVAVDVSARVSWALSGFEPDALTTLLSDGFNALKGKDFDLFFTSPPVQPKTGKTGWKGHNESGADGRKLFDVAINGVPVYVRDGGLAVITSSSRHGTEVTDRNLQRLERDGSISGFDVVYKDRVPLDMEQYGDYVDFWLRRGRDTGVPRIYPDGVDELGEPQYTHDLLVYAVEKGGGRAELGFPGRSGPTQAPQVESRGSGAEIAARKGKEALPANPTWDNLIDNGPSVTPIAGRPNIAILNANPFRFGIGNLGWQAVADYSLQRGENVHIAFADTQRTEKPFLNSHEQVMKEDGTSDFDVIGISVPFEDTYVNALNMIGEAGLPLRSADRLDDNESPLIVAGGMSMINPMPLEPFMDIIVLKEGREAFHEISTKYRELRQSGVSKRAALEEFAEIPGVFIPSLYEIEYDDTGSLTKFEPRTLDNGLQAPREIFARETLDMVEQPIFSLWTSKYATYEQENYVSIMAAMGCDKKCSFCVVGAMQGDMDGRAVKTDLETVFDIIDQRTDEHFVQARPDPVVKIFFSSAFGGDKGSITSQSIKDVLRGLVDRGLQGRVGSLNISQADEELFQLLKAVGQTEVTFAPETTEAARKSIGKAYSKDAKLEQVAEWCGQYGMDLNVYSLGSLPGETDDVTREYAQLLLRLYDKMNPGSMTPIDDTGRMPQMAVHYNPVFNKAQTDQQINASTRPEESRRKLGILQEALGDQPNIRIVSVIDDPMVYYQPLLALGDNQSADLLEHLSLTHRGKLQSQITEAEWGQAISETGFDDTRYFTDRDPEKTLPWEPFRFSKVRPETRKRAAKRRVELALQRRRPSREEETSEGGVVFLGTPAPAAN